MTRRISDLRGADPYALLEVSREATSGDIRRAYRRVVRQAHPDMLTGDEDRTKMLNIARDVLLDPALRAEYDQRTQSGRAPVSAWDAEDIIVDIIVDEVYSQPVRRPVARPARSGGGSTLGEWALLAALLCAPLGVVLGVVALLRHPRPVGYHKACAIAAVCLGGLAILCLGYLVFGPVGSSVRLRGL